MAEGLALSEMLSRITEDPKAVQMLSQILGGMGATESEEAEAPSLPEAQPQSDKAEPAVSLPFSLPSGTLSHGKGRRGVLNALRPYLSQRRCASLDRMIRAMELYEIIMETQLLKGGITNV